MFSLNETNKFMVYSTSVDLRKGVEPLCGLARICGRKPSDGSVYVYFNRSRTLSKNWLFVDSGESAKDAAVYMTLIGSCNLLGLAPYRHFEYILPRLHANMAGEEYKELLPYKVAEKTNRG